MIHVYVNFTYLSWTFQYCKSGQYESMTCKKNGFTIVFGETTININYYTLQSVL